jgi:formylglycine-generating enzyme required for sulfatase activity
MGNSNSETQSVASLAPNACGLYDMSGNVCEWVHDGYAEYPDQLVTDPSGDSPASERVSRGGDWSSDPVDARNSYRDHGDPGAGYGVLGFRLFRTSP